MIEIDEILIQDIIKTYDISKNKEEFEKEIRIFFDGLKDIGKGSDKSKKYQVVSYMKIEPDEEAVEPQTYEECLKDKESQELMQPENIFQIEEIE